MRGWHVIALFGAGCGRLDFVPTTPRDRSDCAMASPGEPCFTLRPTLANWDEARLGCTLLAPPARLATITNANENAVAAALAATIPFAASDTNTNQRQRMWLGANSIAVVGDWVWESGLPFDYANWRVGEPGTPATERCVILLGSQAGVWDDRSCATPYDGYLCEHD